jgi:methionine-gamma-lyase
MLLKKLGTLCVQDRIYDQGAVNMPIFHSSTFAYESLDAAARAFEGDGSWVYARVGNPTVFEFEEKMTLLEGGLASVAFGSGMAAIFAVILSTCKPGDTILCVDEVYGGTHELLKTAVKDLNIEVKTFAPSLEDFPFHEKNVKLIYAETPTNPSLHVVDIEKLVDVSTGYTDALVCIDNTFATPVYQQPLRLNADISLHSATKYINGCGEIIGGVVTVGKWAGTDFFDRLMQKRLCTGGIMSPDTASKCLTGIKSLAVRMEKHNENAYYVAHAFAAWPEYVKMVRYPGYGGMVSVEFNDKEAAKKFVDNFSLGTIAVSLGEAKTLVNHPASMTHSTYSSEELAEIGLTEGLVRFSIGLEEKFDLDDSIQTAFELLKEEGDDRPRECAAHYRNRRSRPKREGVDGIPYEIRFGSNV